MYELFNTRVVYIKFTLILEKVKLKNFFDCEVIDSTKRFFCREFLARGKKKVVFLKTAQKVHGYLKKNHCKIINQFKYFFTVKVLILQIDTFVVIFSYSVILQRQSLSEVQNKIVGLNCRPQDSVSSSGTCVLISVARGYVLDSKLFLIIQPVFILPSRFKRVTIGTVCLILFVILCYLTTLNRNVGVSVLDLRLTVDVRSLLPEG